MERCPTCNCKLPKPKLTDYAKANSKAKVNTNADLQKPIPKQTVYKREAA
jgi:hypothetical protein